jgi:hypothetical protein
MFSAGVGAFCLSVSPNKQKNVSQRSLRLRGECKHFYALLNNSQRAFPILYLELSSFESAFL